MNSLARSSFRARLKAFALLMFSMEFDFFPAWTETIPFKEWMAFAASRKFAYILWNLVVTLGFECRASQIQLSLERRPDVFQSGAFREDAYDVH